VVRRVCEFASFLALLLAAAACRSKPKPQAAASSALFAPRLAPLSAPGWLVDLDVPGFGSSQLAVPVGARQSRPIVIALHGIADRPEWACGAYRGILGGNPFVLCPRGVKREDLGASEDRYTFGSVDDTARELRAALSALKHTYGAYVAAGTVILGGFEVGADRAAEIALQEPSFFSRLVLVAPARETWPSSVASLFGRQGGERVLFGCGPSQRSEAAWQAELTKQGGAEARVAVLRDGAPDLGPDSVSRLALFGPFLEASQPKPLTYQNLKGNALPLGGPVVGRPKP
jgi:pimeloyl-ACP methyl ester carboxylesterase